ncbi:Dehydrogenase/reductase SDR family member 7B [Bagarius yarrelli]|uniref:Dehydrogenase/reductase SDR family member 7B n=1 Tax=Bagarius yarrelli TaxID=175774 RepID=A0A556TUT3_BAGYA|nr:Dehydrogenase/reductase SDR family member 7B [Bagarius yarrelli]
MERLGCVGQLTAGAIGLLLLLRLIQRARRRKQVVQDKVVVITGASSGLGKECARVFHAAGARLILCGRDQKRLQEVVEELRAILPSMVERGSGHIVVISSVQGKISIPYRSAYSASKHATQAFFDCLRAEVERFGLHVSVISPGYIRTNLSRNAVTGDGSRYGVMDKTTAEGLDPVDVAISVLKAVTYREKDVLLVGLIPALAIYLRTLWPAAFFKVMASRAKKEKKIKEQ